MMRSERIADTTCCDESEVGGGGGGGWFGGLAGPALAAAGIGDFADAGVDGDFFRFRDPSTEDRICKQAKKRWEVQVRVRVRMRLGVEVGLAVSRVCHPTESGGRIRVIVKVGLRVVASAFAIVGGVQVLIHPLLRGTG